MSEKSKDTAAALCRQLKEEGAFKGLRDVQWCTDEAVSQLEITAAGEAARQGNLRDAVGHYLQSLWPRQEASHRGLPLPTTPDYKAVEVLHDRIDDIRSQPGFPSSPDAPRGGRPRR